MRMIERAAPAKLNLGLRVFPLGMRRADGFHEVETWMVGISWHDVVRVEVGEGVTGLMLEVTGRAEGVPVEIGKNLAGRAAVALGRAAGIEEGEMRARIILHKVVPPGGGLGGGSSDAAKVLVLLNEAWGLKWEAEKLEGIAATLGSDVPFFVRGEARLCTGRGEVMTPLERAGGAMFAVLLVPPFGCATKAVYGAFDAGARFEGKGPTDWGRVSRATVRELDELLVNDLEPAAFLVAAGLGELRARAEKVVGRRVHMTGSGSTLFCLWESGAEAGEVRERLEREMGEACACVAVRVG